MYRDRELIVGIEKDTEDYDLPSAMEFLKNRKDFFKDLRLDTALNEMLCDAREFADEIDIPANFELTQPRHRVRRRNVNFDYEAREDPTLKYKTEFYFSTLDKAINALESRQAHLNISPTGVKFSQILRPTDSANENSPTFDISPNVSQHNRAEVEQLLSTYTPKKTETVNIELYIAVTEDEPISHKPRRLPNEI
ncbi:uncharacterized protein TNCV_85051 [Trichonephila clavipes]|nr:uncharacterized protein TNCV_85051 [Trichonephila clavipes]